AMSLTIRSLHQTRRVLAAIAVSIFAAASVHAQDVRAVQAREAQKADERTLAYFARFRTALIDRFGGDPLLSMLVFSENEASALVHTNASAPPQLVIFQEGKWIGTDGRELRPWAGGADPAIARFRLSKLTEAFVRERFRAHRAQTDRATDSVASVKVGYFAKPFDRLILEMQVLSTTRYSFAAVAFDLATGTPLDVDKAIADARSQRQEAERKEAERRAAEPKVVAQPKREEPPPEHCQPENAFREGLAGREYRGGCDSTFARNHRAASKVAELRKELGANRSAIEWREAELRGNRASNDRRNNLRNEVRDLDRRRQGIRSQLEHAEGEMRRLRS
ncbi:MAG TPA: hypothetical protein VNG69_02625, partial [Casimicrobiaceae bacterium]|nr:hypothetical protein [Casimicrobiaceae bacterium]